MMALIIHPWITLNKIMWKRSMFMFSRSNPIIFPILLVLRNCNHGLPDRNVKLRVGHAPGMAGTFPPIDCKGKPLDSDPGMPHEPWCMPGSLTCSGGENVPGIPGACATRNFMSLVRVSWSLQHRPERRRHYMPSCHEYAARSPLPDCIMVCCQNIGTGWENITKLTW